MQTQTGSREVRASGRKLLRSRWWLPIWTLGLGLVFVIAQLIAGNARSGAITAALFVGVAALFYAAERSEAFRGIGGAAGDERFRGIESTAMSFAGRVMAVSVFAAMVVELARGNDGTQYSWIVALGTLAYLGSIVWLQRRR